MNIRLNIVSCIYIYSIIPCILYNVYSKIHCILYNVYSTIHCILYNVWYWLYSKHRLNINIHCIVYYIVCSTIPWLCTIQYTLHFIQCVLVLVIILNYFANDYAVCTVHYTVHTTHCVVVSEMVVYHTSFVIVYYLFNYYCYNCYN